MIGLIVLLLLLIVGAIVFIPMTGEDDTAQTAGKKEEVKQEEINNEDKTEYEKELEESIGEDALSEEKMLEIGKKLYTEYMSMYFADKETEFEEIVRNTNTNEALVEELKDCCFNPNLYEDYQITFENEKVFQTGKNEFEYSAISTMTGLNTETNEVEELQDDFTAQIIKNDEGEFIFQQMVVSNE